MDVEHENVEIESSSYDDEDSDIDVENVNDSESDNGAEALRHVDDDDDGDDEDDEYDEDEDGNRNTRSGCHNAMERMRREKLTALFKAVENKLVQLNKLKPATCSKDKDGKKSKDATLEATAATLLENHDTLSRLGDIELITDKLFNEYFERPHVAGSRKRIAEASGSSIIESTSELSASSSNSSKRQRKNRT